MQENSGSEFCDEVHEVVKKYHNEHGHYKLCTELISLTCGYASGNGVPPTIYENVFTKLIKHLANFDRKEGGEKNGKA